MIMYAQIERSEPVTIQTCECIFAPDASNVVTIDKRASSAVPLTSNDT